MNLKKLALAIAAGSTLLAAAPAFANPPHWAPAHGWRAKHHHPHYAHRGHGYVYVPARPVYVPARRVYVPAPPPVVYYPARPVIYGHVPVGPDVRIGFGVRF